ncbi:TraR/DksA C4-type zinc finger protein [Chitinophaga costaii]|uniref:TraR/DksA C4-type zinc finger protein n=1 Tax=Chitinophaga costaii TaxID=1335309 RepID=UPI001F0BED0F|nr:TraR/DksA C4-type zinc finger protein [Chitinophaga costaii]
MPAKVAPKTAPKTAAKPVSKPLAKPAAAPKKGAVAPKVAAPVKAVPAPKAAVKKVPAPPAPAKKEEKQPVAPTPTATKVATVAKQLDKPTEAPVKSVEPDITQYSEKEVAMPVKNKVVKDSQEKVEKEVKAPAKEPVKKAAEKKTTKSASASAVAYQPEFTKSILDQPETPVGPVYRYSDAELQEFKELIQKKLEAARKELVYLQGLITRKDEAGTDDTENKYMSMEDGGGSQEREQLNQMASRQIQYADHLEKAMMRIENKTYGVCRVTGKLIDKNRLRAVPHATLSIEAKLAKSK